MVNAVIDGATHDLNEGCLKLRDDLVFVPQKYAGKCYVHIEVSNQAKFYRVGFDEYVFLSLLDGKTSFAAALTVVAQKLGARAFTQQQATQVYKWVLENDLGVVTNTDSNGPQEFDPELKRTRSLREVLNPFAFRLRLFCPDRLIAATLPYTRLLFHHWTTLCICILAIVACVSVLVEWDRFIAASSGLLAPSNWVLMIACWVMLKGVHEFGHAICCRTYGGRVGDLGIMFILFAPLAYVDVTTSWRFASKWQRIHVALAGIQMEAAAASIAAILWHFTDSALTAQMLVNIIVMASVTTVLFNLNPLMRFDGYFVLSDLIEYPNLYQDATRVVNEAASTLFYGRDSLQVRSSFPRYLLTLLYGSSCWVWRALVCCTLLIVASTLFHGAGIVLAALGLLTWIARPIRAIVTKFLRFGKEQPRRQLRAFAVGTALALLWSGLWFGLPSPTNTSNPGIVDYARLAIVRVQSPGFVEQVFAGENALVRQGDVLVRLRNPDLESEYRELELIVEQTRQRHTIALQQRNVAVAQIESVNLEMTRQQLREMRLRLDSLDVVAPADGRVIARGLIDRVGTYVQEGEELLAIGDENAKEVVLSISHDDVQDALACLDTNVALRIGSRPPCRGRLIRVEPRATTMVTHPALLTVEGGPLAGRQNESARSERDSIELIEPRFKATVMLSEETSNDVFCGERGYAMMGVARRPVGVELYRFVSQWIDRKLTSHVAID